MALPGHDTDFRNVQIVLTFPLQLISLPTMQQPRRRGYRSSPRTSTTNTPPARGMTRAVRKPDRKPDHPALRRIPVSGRRSRLRSGVARIPRRHRHHQRMVVIDALSVPMRGRSLAVDGESEGFVLDDDGVGRRRLAPLPGGADGQPVRVGESEHAVVEALHIESALVHQPVMGRTQKDEVAERGLAAVGPVLDVVAVEPVGRGAAGEAAPAAGCSAACAAIAASSALRMRAPISGGNRPCTTTVPSSSCQKVRPRFSCWASARSVSSARFARRWRRTNFSTCWAVPCSPMLSRSASFPEVAMRVRARTLE